MRGKSLSESIWDYSFNEGGIMLNPAIIVTDEGHEIPLKQWQVDNFFDRYHVGEYINLKYDHVDCDNELILCAPIIRVFDDLREMFGHSLMITSGYRTERKQQELRKRFNKDGKHIVANHSPHRLGLALDVDLKNKEETLVARDMLRHLRDLRYPWLRIGWERYVNVGMSFVHIDCAPFYFGRGGVWQDRNNIPASWRLLGVEW